MKSRERVGRRDRYLRRVGAHDLPAATDLVDHAIDRDGVGASNEAFADASRSLTDRIVLPAGTVDIQTAVEHVALRIVDTAGLTSAEDIAEQRALLVFLGRDGLPYAARDDAAPIVEQHEDSVPKVSATPRRRLPSS